MLFVAINGDKSISIHVDDDMKQLTHETTASTATTSSSSRKRQDNIRSSSSLSLSSVVLSTASQLLRQASRYFSDGEDNYEDGMSGVEKIWTCNISVYSNTLSSTIANTDTNTNTNADNNNNNGKYQNGDDINLSPSLRPLLPEQQSNAISTTKYSLLSWLPVSILEQFKRVANFYFLVISILMIIGTYCPEYFISPLDPRATVVTLVFVLLISSIKEGYEDYERYQYDCIENEREVIVCIYDIETNTMKETKKQSSEINCGDIIKLEGRSVVPADLVIIHTSTYNEEAELGSQCYVETSNIRILLCLSC